MGIRSAFLTDILYLLRAFHERIANRLNHTHRPREILERRKLYPRVKLYGGLYCPRRPIVDDTLIREIESAWKRLWSRGFNEKQELRPVKGFEDEWPSEESSHKLEYPTYVTRRATPGPTHCFGGGITFSAPKIFSHIFR